MYDIISLVPFDLVFDTDFGIIKFVQFSDYGRNLEPILRGGRTAEPRLALHHLPHGRPVFHRHAGGRRPRRTGRRAARHARRTRTVEFRNTLIP